ncbi:MAG: serine hydrolase domain-containing protein [Henriciella sp.]|nr:serine hydrolase domain-containing protein [Henriciella sp.]
MSTRRLMLPTFLVFVAGFLGSTLAQSEPDGASPLASGEALDAPAPAAPIVSDEWLEAWLQRNILDPIEMGHATAASVAIVANGEVVLAEQYGAFDPMQDIPIEPHHQFMIASVSKSFSGLAIARLVEDGLLPSPTAKANDYMTRYQLEGDWGAKVTVADLSAHSAGLDSPGFGSAVGDQEIIPATPDYIRKKMPGIVREPGKFVTYANYGPPLVGVVAEDLSGLRYDEYLHEHVLRPLGMADSAFEYDPTGGPTLVRAGVYDPETPDVPMYRATVTVNDPFVAAAGSIQASARDMAKYLNGLLGHRPDVLTPEMLAIQRDSYANNYSGLAKVGLGLLNEQWNDYETWQHGGIISGFRSQLFIVPEADLGVFVVFAGGTSPFFGKGGDTGQTVHELMIEVLGPVVPKPPIEPVTDPAEFEGRYWFSLRAHQTPEAIWGLERIWTIEKGENGEMLINGTPNDEIAPGLFQERRDDGRPPYLMAVADDKILTRLSYAERVSGLGDPRWITIFGLTFAAVAVTGLIAIFGTGLWRFGAVLAGLAVAVVFVTNFLPALQGRDLSYELFRGETWRFDIAATGGWLTLAGGLAALYAGGARLVAGADSSLSKLAASHRILVGIAAIGFFFVLKAIYLV